MSYYAKNKAAAVYKQVQKTLTDQGAARETDINVIVNRFTRTGMVPTGSRNPLYGDWTQFPPDLRGVIELARSGEQHRKNLPEALRNMTLEELSALTPEQLKEKLTPAPTDKPAEQPPKEGDK